MCGRYTIGRQRLDHLESALAADLGDISARYNIAPGTDCPVITPGGAGPELRECRWGLVPHWLKEPRTKYSTINAKVETVASRPFYRDAYRRRRCLVPADGYYEWQPGRTRKQPYYIHLGGRDFAFAGLWDRWQGTGAEPLDSFTIITGPAAPAVQPIHGRMPLILPDEALARWLDPGTPSRQLAELLQAPLTGLSAHPVSARVNNPRNEGPDLIAPRQ